MFHWIIYQRESWICCRKWYSWHNPQHIWLPNAIYSINTPAFLWWNRFVWKQQTERSLNRNGCFKIFCFGAVFIIKQKVQLYCEHSPNAESNGYDRELINSLLGQIDHLKRELEKKHNITSNTNKEAIFNSRAKRSLYQECLRKHRKSFIKLKRCNSR